MTDAEIREAHAACVKRMRESECMARAVPSVIDVHIALARMRIVVDRREMVGRALFLGLALADAP